MDSNDERGVGSEATEETGNKLQRNLMLDSDAGSEERGVSSEAPEETGNEKQRNLMIDSGAWADIEDEPAEVRPLWTAAGGKWTSRRNTAQEAGQRQRGEEPKIEEIVEKKGKTEKED